MTRWVEGAFIVLLLSFATGGRVDAAPGQFFPERPWHASVHYPFAGKGLIRNSPHLRPGIRDRTSGARQCARPKVVLGQVSRRCYLARKTWVDPACPDIRGARKRISGSDSICRQWLCLRL